MQRRGGDHLTDIRTRLGAAVKAHRAGKEMTQEQLAERSDLSYKFIGEIERGAANPTVVTLDRLAQALGVPMSILVLETRDRHANDYQISHNELVRVREALESIADVTNRLGRVSYPRPKRRKRV